MHKSKKRETVLYLGPVDFPSGGAAARRILGISLAVMDAGYDVIIGSGQLRDPKLGKDFNYKGIGVYSLSERNSEHLPTIFKHFSYIGMGAKTISWLEGLNFKPKAIFLYSGYSPYLLRLIPWCRDNNVPLIFDAVEWYQASHQRLGILSPYQLNIELAMRYLIPKVRNVISISSYLSNYYKNNSCNTILIPPLIDTNEYIPKDNVNNSRFIDLAYTGSPGKKDLLEVCLEGILKVDPTGTHFRFTIAGISKSELLKYSIFDKIKTFPKNIVCKGVVSQSEAMAIVRDADFTLLLRKDERYANAGFPTKFVESFAVGTPVISNLTSDMGNYLKDKETGIVCEEANVPSLCKALLKVVSLSESEKVIMSNKARLVSESQFDIKNYTSIIDCFLKSLILIEKKK